MTWNSSAAKNLTGLGSIEYILGKVDKAAIKCISKWDEGLCLPTVSLMVMNK